MPATHTHLWCPSVATLGETAHGPCLCTPGATSDAPPHPDISHQPGVHAIRAALVTTPDMRRRATVETALAQLATVGRAWGDARTWAETTGRWTASELKAINPIVVDAYLTHLRGAA